jgi:hypothetical protein
MARAKLRRIDRYVRTAARILAEQDQANGCLGNLTDECVLYSRDSYLRDCVIRAMGEVRPINVPRRAAKHYSTFE